MLNIAGTCLLAAILAVLTGCASSQPESAPAVAAEEAGRQSLEVELFDGQSLEGWDGAAGYWRVEDGAITGETTAETEAGSPTHLIWRGGEVDDFVLSFEYRVSADGNSGFQYRSEEMDDYMVHGYQADFEGGDQWNGVLVEMGGRLHLAMRGQQVRVEEDGNIAVLDSVGDPAELQSVVREDGWNEFEIVAEGSRLIHKINGRVMIDAIDEQSESARGSGIVALQLNRSRPMKVQFRDIVLRRKAEL